MSPRKKKKQDEPDENNGLPTKEDIENANVKELKLFCNKFNLKVSGRKADLIERLLEHISTDGDEEPEVETPSELGELPPEPIDEGPEDPPPPPDYEPEQEVLIPEGLDDTESGLVGEMKPGGKSDPDSFTCSLCDSKLHGHEDVCPGCGVTFGSRVAALIDDDWDVYRDIPTADEVKTMSYSELKDILEMLGFTKKMKKSEMRDLLIELIDDEEEEDNIVETIKEVETFNPKKALNETNYIRDNLQKYTEAITLYDRIIEWSLEHTSVMELDEVLVQKGICLQYMNEFTRAMDCYNLALEVNPKNSEIKALIMGAKALDNFYDKPKKSSSMDPTASLQERVRQLIEGEPRKPQVMVDQSYSPEFKEAVSDRVEVVIAPSKKPVDEDPHFKPSMRSGRDDQILKDMDEMSERLERLKKLKESIDIHDIEEKGHRSVGIEIDKKVATATRIEEPQASPAPKPQEVDAEIVQGGSKRRRKKAPALEGPEEDQDTEEEQVGEQDTEEEQVGGQDEAWENAGQEGQIPAPPADMEIDADLVEDVVAEIESFNGELDLEDKEVDAELLEDKPPIDIEEQSVLDNEVSENVCSSAGEIVSSGNKTMDKLLDGGFPGASNVLINAPPFTGSEMIIYEFVKSYLSREQPAIIITTSDPIMVIRTNMNQVMPDFEESESKELVAWIDPRSESARKRFDIGGMNLPEDHALIVKGIRDLAEQFKGMGTKFNVCCVSLTPVISYREPKEIKTFLGQLTSLVTEMGLVGLYLVDSDMHDETEKKLLEDAMAGVIEVKENASSRGKDDKNLLKISKMPHCKETRWLPFFSDDASYRIG